MASNYLHISNQKSYVDANLNLLRMNDRLQIRDLNLSASIDELKTFASDKADQCNRVALQNEESKEETFRICSRLANQYGITPPDPKRHSYLISACINRLCCKKWWKRCIDVKRRQAIESVARDLGLVHKHKSAYSSQHSQHDRAAQRANNIAYLENTYITNDQSETFCLKDLYDRSVSNPLIRRAELMTRIKGFELMADELGDVGEFYTITTPSRMHARLNKKGLANPKYDGTNPYDGQQYLQTTWTRIRAKLHREGIYVYGFRVAEPNHDGTPHWHLLLFMEKSVRQKVRRIFQKYALAVDGDEKGAKQHRFKAVAIDKKKGSAAGYIAKYVVKNIDGQHIDEDLYGNDGKSAASAIDTWASRWRIRQFQQIGGPSVTVWRELRRLATDKANVVHSEKNLLSKAAHHATSADWAAFCMIMGGPRVRRADHPIRPLYEEPVSVDKETGELLEEGLTPYGDPAKSRLKGLITHTRSVITRRKKWTLTQAPPPTEECMLAQPSYVL